MSLKKKCDGFFSKKCCIASEKCVKARFGGVAEWSIAAVLKTVVPVRVPGVRIPLPPLRKEPSWVTTALFLVNRPREDVEADGGE